MRYRRKLEVIHALQYTGKNLDEFKAWFGEANALGQGDCVVVRTGHWDDKLSIYVSEWIVQLADLKPEKMSDAKFKELYEPIEEN